MAYVPMENLLGRTESIYKLVILAAKRAIELNQGAGRLSETTGPNEKVSTVALKEIEEGKIMLKKEEQPDEKAKRKK